MSKRLLVFDVFDDHERQAKRYTDTVQALNSELLGDPFVDRSAILSLRERSVEIEQRLQDALNTMRQAFAYATKSVTELPQLPRDCWQIIMELALRRRALSHFGHGLCVTTPAWIPRSDMMIREATKLLRMFRCLNHKFRRVVDRRLVETLVLPARLGNISVKAYVDQTKRLAERFRNAHTVVIAKEHGKTCSLTVTIQQAAVAAKAQIKGRKRLGVSPLMISEMPARSYLSLIETHGILSIGNGLTPRPQNEPFVSQTYTDRMVHNTVQLCDPKSDLAHLPKMAAQVVYSQPFFRYLPEFARANLRLNPLLANSCTHLYLEYGRFKSIPFERLELPFVPFPEMCEEMPQLRELHLVGLIVQQAGLEELFRWHAEAFDRYKIYVHLYGEPTMSTGERLGSEWMCDKFLQRGLALYCLRDAEALIDSASRIGRVL